MRITREQVLPWATVVSLLALAVGLRCIALDKETAWCDEALTTICLPAENAGAYFDCAFTQDPTLRLAPVYYWTQYAWSVPFGGSLVALRALSVFLSVIAGLQLYGLVRAIHSHRAGCWALFFFGVSLFEIYYGQEVRFYSLMNVFALAALHGALWYTRGRTGRGLALATIGNAGLVWTHTFGAVFALALGVYMLRYIRAPRRLFPWLGAHAAMAFALIGWLAYLDYDVSGRSTAYNDIGAGWRELANTWVQFSGGRFSNLDPAPYLPGGWSADLVLAALFAALVAGAPLALLRAESANRKRVGEFLLLLFALALPVCMLFILGKLWKPCFFTRYVIYSALPLYGVAGIALASIRRRAFYRTLALLMVLLFAWQNMALPRPFRADYGAVARAVRADVAEESVVLALKPFNHVAAVYALREQPVDVELLYGLKEIVGIARARAMAGTSVWAVFYRWSELDRFEAGFSGLPLTLRRFESAGMPPLTYYHITRSDR